MRIRLNNLGRLHANLKADFISAFERVLDSSAFIQGEEVRRFENAFSNYIGVENCVGLANGTDSLEIGMQALGIGVQDIVLVPSLTFVATAEAVVRCGATPFFVEVDPETLCVNEETLRKAIEESPKPPRAMIVVHLYGRACPMGEIIRLATKQNILVIEDCAQAHGARLQEKFVGSFGEVGSFSFYPGKNLGALGDAGAATTKHRDLAEKIRLLRDHGRSEKYVHQIVGRNSRLDSLQAAFLSEKLKHLPKWTLRRQEIATLYRTELQNSKGLQLLAEAVEPQSHVYHQFVIRVQSERRDELVKFLSSQEIETIIHYPLPVHLQPAFQRSLRAKNLDHTELAAQEVLSLPMDPLLTDKEVLEVTMAVRKFFL